ncbi:MAG: type II secretion system major pseudopilin GspG [Burkholderiales bacterium]|nr:type II secretion system major pseudopilin GspG [Burkholderiales bacterium]
MNAVDVFPAGARSRCAALPGPAARWSRARGFTLLELLVTLVIVGLLAGIVGPNVFKQMGKSEVKAARAQMDGLQKALDQYRLDVGRYPSSEQGLAALWSKPGDEPRWAGPYLSKAVPQDPWGRDYLYRSPGEHGEYDLATLGKDGREGGDGENQDVASW